MIVCQSLRSVASSAGTDPMEARKEALHAALGGQAESSCAGARANSRGGEVRLLVRRWPGRRLVVVAIESAPKPGGGQLKGVVVLGLKLKAAVASVEALGVAEASLVADGVGN